MSHGLGLNADLGSVLPSKDNNALDNNAGNLPYFNDLETIVYDMRHEIYEVLRSFTYQNTLHPSLKTIDIWKFHTDTNHLCFAEVLSAIDQCRARLGIPPRETQIFAYDDEKGRKKFYEAQVKEALSENALKELEKNVAGLHDIKLRYEDEAQGKIPSGTTQKLITRLTKNLWERRWQLLGLECYAIELIAAGISRGYDGMRYKLIDHAVENAKEAAKRAPQKPSSTPREETGNTPLLTATGSIADPKLEAKTPFATPIAQPHGNMREIVPDNEGVLSKWCCQENQCTRQCYEASWLQKCWESHAVQACWKRVPKWPAWDGSRAQKWWEEHPKVRYLTGFISGGLSVYSIAHLSAKLIINNINTLSETSKTGMYDALAPIAAIGGGAGALGFGYYLWKREKAPLLMHADLPEVPGFEGAPPYAYGPTSGERERGSIAPSIESKEVPLPPVPEAPTSPKRPGSAAALLASSMASVLDGNARATASVSVSISADAPAPRGASLRPAIGGGTTAASS